MITGKTRVKVIMDTPQCTIKKGDFGYIEGYCRAGDDRPYAIVVSGKKIDMVLIYALEVVD